MKVLGMKTLSWNSYEHSIRFWNGTTSGRDWQLHPDGTWDTFREAMADMEVIHFNLPQHRTRRMELGRKALEILAELESIRFVIVISVSQAAQATTPFGKAHREMEDLAKRVLGNRCCIVRMPPAYRHQLRVAGDDHGFVRVPIPLDLPICAFSHDDYARLMYALCEFPEQHGSRMYHVQAGAFTINEYVAEWRRVNPYAHRNWRAVQSEELFTEAMNATVELTEEEVGELREWWSLCEAGVEGLVVNTGDFEMVMGEPPSTDIARYIQDCILRMPLRRNKKPNQQPWVWPE